MTNSLYELICTNMDEDCALPQGFMLPQDEGDDQEIPFADGVMDGTTLYHMPPAELPAEARKRLGELLLLAGS